MFPIQEGFIGQEQDVKALLSEVHCSFSQRMGSVQREKASVRFWNIEACKLLIILFSPLSVREKERLGL